MPWTTPQDTLASLAAAAERCDAIRVAAPPGGDGLGSLVDRFLAPRVRWRYPADLHYSQSKEVHFSREMSMMSCSWPSPDRHQLPPALRSLSCSRAAPPGERATAHDEP